MTGYKDLLVLFPLMLGACTAQLEQDLSELRQEFDTSKGVVADHTSQLSSLQMEVRQLQGRLEELDFNQKKKVGSEVDTLRDQLSSLKRRIPPPAVVPSSALDEDERFVPTIGQPEIVERFSKALGHVREGNFSEAIPLLQTTLDASEGYEYSALVLFWLGVVYEGLEDNRNALVAYNQIISQFKSHPRAPLAMLRLAQVIQRTGDSKTAQITLKRLVTEYPRSSEAAQAQSKLKDLSR